MWHLVAAPSCVMCVCSRFQRKIKAQPVEAGDQQPGLWLANPVSHVHGREPPRRLAGGPETAAQVRSQTRDALFILLFHCCVY